MMEKKLRVKFIAKPDKTDDPGKETPYQIFLKNTGYTTKCLVPISKGKYAWDGNFLMDTGIGDSLTLRFRVGFDLKLNTTYNFLLKSLEFSSLEELITEFKNTVANTPLPKSLSRKQLVDVVIAGEKMELNISRLTTEDKETLIKIILNHDSGKHWIPIIQDLIWIDWGWKKNPTPKVKKPAKKLLTRRAQDRVSTFWSSLGNINDTFSISPELESSLRDELQMNDSEPTEQAGDLPY